jgi:hypothetical protein
MRIKNLAAAAVCIAALGGTAGAVPAAAKKDNGHGKIRRCETPAAKHFKCVTEDGDVTLGTCPVGYDVIATITIAADYDLNDDGLICSSATLGYADDTVL